MRLDAESETLLPAIHSETGKGWWSEGAAALRADPGGMPSHVVAYQCHGTNVGEMGTLRKGDGGVTSGVPFVTHALKAEGADASEDATGRGVPLVVDTLQQPGIMQSKETQYACAQKAYAQEILQCLRKEIGEEAFTEWGLGVLDSFQSSEVLRYGLLRGGQQRTEEAYSQMVGSASTGEIDLPGWPMREMRQAGRERRGSHQWRLERPIADKLAAYLSKLSQPEASAAEAMRDLWQASEGIGVLRQALSAVQEIWRSNDRQTKPALRANAVRRLTPREAERLQGFPDDHTNIPGAADGPRYRAIGNSMAVPVMAWIGRRITAALTSTGAGGSEQ